MVAYSEQLVPLYPILEIWSYFGEILEEMYRVGWFYFEN